MKNVEKSVTVAASRLSRQMATNDDAAANEEDVEEQIEEEDVEKAALENRSDVPIPFKSNQQIETADNAAASREEVEEQAEESRVDKVAFEDGVSTSSATEYIRSGRAHD